MADRITSDPNPVILHFPKCPECDVAYVLRRCYLFDGGYSWLWQRDCKHKNAQPVVEPELIDGHE